MEEIINRIVNGITVGIFGTGLWSVIVLITSKLRNRPIKNFGTRALVIFITFCVIGAIAGVSII